MRRSCNALTIMLACLACTAWAVGPSHSEAKAKPGWAAPIDCGYQPQFEDGLLEDDDYSPLPVEDQAESGLRAQAAPEAVEMILANERDQTPPAWFGCGGMPTYPCGNFLAGRSLTDSAPYTRGPYWRHCEVQSPAETRPASDHWFDAATGYDPAYDAAVTGEQEWIFVVAPARRRRVHWDTHDDYIACPLGLDESGSASSIPSEEQFPDSAYESNESGYEIASMADLEGGSAWLSLEYNYMSAHDPAFGNAWRDEVSSADAEEATMSDSEALLDQLEEEFFASLEAASLECDVHDFRRWNCDQAMAASGAIAAVGGANEGDAYRDLVAASTRASQWIVVAAARTIECVSDVLSDMSLSIESAVEDARQAAASCIDEPSWE